MSHQKAPVNKNVLLPLFLFFFFFSFPLEEQCVDESGEKGSLGFARIQVCFPGWMFSGVQSWERGGGAFLVFPKGVVGGSLRTAETWVRAAITTQ